jgi:hypothetical protein
MIIDVQTGRLRFAIAVLCVHLHMHVHIHEQIHYMYSNTYTYTDTYTYTHTYTCANIQIHTPPHNGCNRSKKPYPTWPRHKSNIVNM